MSDHESELNPAGPEVEPGVTGSFSANGNDSGAIAVATEGIAGEHLDDGAAFLADLARAMQATAAAEQARVAEGTGLRHQAHLDAIRAREALEAEELREFAKEDVKGIDAWSDGEIKRVKLERERRIASRREQLQIRLEEHRAVVAREVEAVEAAVASYKVDIERFFSRLESETDPVEIARQAGNRPAFPVLELIGPNDAPVVPAAPVYYSAPIEAPAPVAPVAPVLAEASETGDQSPGDDGPAAAGPMIGVMDAQSSGESVETSWDPGVEVIAAPAAEESPVSEGSEVPEGAVEPVPVAAEARVVMPRSTGAGSWLRWPNNSVDRTDSGR